MSCRFTFLFKMQNNDGQIWCFEWRTLNKGWRKLRTRLPLAIVGGFFASVKEIPSHLSSNMEEESCFVREGLIQIFLSLLTSGKLCVQILFPNSLLLFGEKVEAGFFYAIHLPSGRTSEVTAVIFSSITRRFALIFECTPGYPPLFKSPHCPSHLSICRGC